MSACGAILTVPEFSESKTNENVNISSIERDMNDFDNSNAWELFYERLQNISSIQTRNLSVDSGLSVENRWKNRYRDVIPYDSTRLLLKSESTGDYINANFVKIESVKTRKYILAQGPLQQTCDHFWQMIWEQQSPAIIMLNRVYERGSLKCHKYFPECEETFDCEAVDLVITCTAEEKRRFYVIKTLHILETSTGKTHHLLHFHYTHWPDFGVPTSPGSMLNFLWDIRHEGVLDDPETPCVVHCSAGIGRSGTFVLIDLALLLIEQFNSMNEISLTDILLSLRQCRMGIVQAAHQLRYSYRAVIEGGKALLETPTSERAFIQFAEDDQLILHPNDEESEDDCDDDNDDDDGDEEFIDDEELIRHLRLRAAAGYPAGDSNRSMDFFENSGTSSSSSEEEEADENEMMRLMAGKRWLQQCVDVNNSNGGVVIKEIAVESQQLQMNDTEPGTNNQSLMQSSDSVVDPKVDVSPSSQPVFTLVTEENVDSPQENDVWTSSSFSSEEADADESEDEEDEEEVARMVDALEAARARRTARLARQEFTSKKLAEITARMRERELVRHRWLPSFIALPLTRWFSESGYVNTPAEAVLTSLGIFALIVGLACGYLYQRG